MNFLSRDEANLLEKKLRRQMADQPEPKLVLYYKSGAHDYSQAANAIAASTGRFTQVTLLFLWCLSGGWREETATSGQWSRYRQWREASGEKRPLYDAPGHQFESHEVEHFSRALDFALQLGWDALVAAKPQRQLLLLSHDDRMEIYRGFERRLLAEKLLIPGEVAHHSETKPPTIPG
jgi:hypothetical protein